MRRIVFLAVLAAVAAAESAYAAEKKDTLDRYESCAAWDEAMTGPIVEQLMQMYGYDYSRYYGYYGWGGGIDDVALSAAADAPMAEGTGSGREAGPGSFTGTNVQEQGVDELDFVKTDGKFIYVLNGSELAIVRSWPATEAAKVGAIAISGTPQSLFLRGDRAIVASLVQPTWEDGAQAGYYYGYYGYYGYGATRLTVVDVSDRSEPKVLREIDVEGSLVNGRMVDGDVYMVLNTPAAVPPEVWGVVTDGRIVMPLVDPSAAAEQQEKVKDQQRAILGARVRAILASDGDTGLLRYSDTRGGSTANGRLLGCSQVLHGDHGTAPGMLALVHLNLDDDHATPDAAGLMGQGWTVYSSEDDLYVALTTGAWWGWGWGWSPSETIEPGTEIHKFHLRGKGGSPEYAASGHVDGWLWSQFAMSEYEGNLRVASTDTDWWWGSGEVGQGSEVAVLADDHEGHLNVIGKVDGISPGEQIYGVRFVGERGYVVTFRQVDPLHVLDLSDPTNPFVAGELQIPGYSSYLHPMDEDHLLAVGVDGDVDGEVSGLKVAIYDVSNPAHPRETHKYTIAGEGWAWSEALYNHHAFTWANGVLTIPAYSYDEEQTPSGDYTYSYWSGALVLRADATRGISEMGRVDHGDLARDLCLKQATAAECDQTYAAYGYYEGYSYGYYAQMRRSIYIDDTLVTISNLGMKFSSLEKPDHECASVLLPEGQYGYYGYN